MQNKILWLQLFADGGAAGDGGAGAGTGDGATGVTAVAAEQQTKADRLAALGVPKSKLNRRAYTQPVQDQAQIPAQDVQQDAAAEAKNQPKEATEQQAKHMTLDEIKAEPEFDKAVQEIVRQRVAKIKGAEESLTKLAPALEILGKKYNVDVSNIDALTSAIVSDDGYYEERAAELGVSVETAKMVEQAERAMKEKQARDAEDLKMQQFRQHMAKLDKEAQALRETVPNFDLRTELSNPTFSQLTASGIPVEQAYFAVHYREMLEASRAEAKRQMAASIQNNMNRPSEGAAKSSVAPDTKFDWRNASKEQREAMKRQIYADAARGVHTPLRG